MIDNGNILGCGLSLTAEQRDDGLRVIVVHIGLVEAVEHFRLTGSCNIDLTQILLAEESLYHSLIALQILTDNLLRILVAVVFCLHLILAVEDERLQIKRSLQRAVTEADGLHRLAAQLFVGKHHAVPGKHRVALDAQVIHGIAEGVCLMLAHTAHLILTGLQIVYHLGLIVKLGIDGQRLHRHTHRVQEALVGTSVVDGGEERLLFIIIFGQQETVSRREEIALEDAFLLAECVHLGHLHIERPHHTGLRVLRLLKVGHQLGEAVAAVEVLGIPLLAFVEGCRLA